MKHVFVQHPLDSIHPQARKAGEASLCAGKQGAEAYWEMHDLLFERASEWSGKEDAVDRFMGYATELGLDDAQFAACLNSDETADQIQSQLDMGSEMGVSGVPAFFVNDWFLSGAQPSDVFDQIIEAALAGEHPPPTPTPLPPGTSPFDVNRDRPGYTYLGDATLGSAEAEVILLQFVDFASEANGAFFSEGWLELLDRYVDPGSVRIVLKHFPAMDQSAASQAAVAAECAGQQGAFWEMHDALFSKQGDWTGAEDAIAVFEDYASALGLDGASFAGCLANEAINQKVRDDVAIAQRNQLAPAPQFVALYGDQGTVVAQADLSDFLSQVIQR